MAGAWAGGAWNPSNQPASYQQASFLFFDAGPAKSKKYSLLLLLPTPPALLASQAGALEFNFFSCCDNDDSAHAVHTNANSLNAFQCSPCLTLKSNEIWYLLDMQSSAFAWNQRLCDRRTPADVVILSCVVFPSITLPLLLLLLRRLFLLSLLHSPSQPIQLIHGVDKC